MDHFITWIKLVFAAITGLLSYVFGGLDMLFYTLLICMAADYITGVLAALYERRLSSTVGYRGILKKVVMLFVVMLAHMIEIAAEMDGIRDLVIGFYIANEGISLLENAGRMNVPAARNLSAILEQLKRDRQ